MARISLSSFLLAMFLAAPDAFAQTPDYSEVTAQTERLAGRTQAGSAILEQLFADTHNAHYLYAQALCLQVGSRWAEAADKFRAFLSQAQGVSAADLSATEEQIRSSEDMALRQGAWQTAAQVSPAALAALPADQPREAPRTLAPENTAVVQTPAVTPRQTDARHSECTKCYPGGLSVIPAADIPMAGVGAGVMTNSQFASSGGESRNVYLTIPYIELGAPGFRNLSLHYHAIIAGWTASGDGQTQYDAVVAQHTIGLKIVPYYSGRGDSFLATLNASIMNASATKTSGHDYVSPHGLLLYSGFAEPLVFKLGIGGSADIAITRGLRNSGRVGYFGQLGGLVYKRDSAYGYLVAELGGTVDLEFKDTVAYSHSGSSSSYATRTNRTLDATHTMDVFFGPIVRGNSYQFKFGVDLPVNKRDQRVDYALVTGLGCLF